MKTTIKILIIVLVAAGIAAAIWAFFKRINDGDTSSIATTEYEKRIEARVSSDIADKSYTSARASFDNIIADIVTESKIETTDGNHVITADEFENCQKIAVTPYLPVFKSYASSYFNRSNWDNKELDDMSSHAKQLLGLNGAKDDSDLNRIVSDVNDYYAALKTVRLSKSVTNVADARRIMNDANGFKRAPLNNNTDLMTKLNEVPSNVRKSIVNSIGYAINNLPTNPYSYKSYDDWYGRFERIKKRIDEYTNAFGRDGTLESYRTSLNKADSRIEDHFLSIAQ